MIDHLCALPLDVGRYDFWTHQVLLNILRLLLYCHPLLIHSRYVKLILTSFLLFYGLTTIELTFVQDTAQMPKLADNDQALLHCGISAQILPSLSFVSNMADTLMLQFIFFTSMLLFFSSLLWFIYFAEIHKWRPPVSPQTQAWNDIKIWSCQNRLCYHCR